jgi:hypothetical protein
VRRAGTLAVLVWAASVWLTAAPDAALQQMYVAVADSKGKPVKGLTAADFSIQLDGSPQEILAAAPATEPVSTVILTDRLGLIPTYSPFDLRQALGDFIKGIRVLNPESKFALTTVDGPVVQVAKFTTPSFELERLIGRLSTMAPDAALLDGLFDAVRSVDAAPTDRRVIFVMYAAYRPDQSNVRPEVVAELLRLSRASLWAIEARAISGTNYSNSARELFIDRGGGMSGGMHEVVGSASGVDSMAKRMAELIGSQYRVTYAPGGSGAARRLVVSVKRDGLKVLAPSWTAR